MTHTNAPTIHSERLTLRAVREDDFDIFAEFMADDRSSFVGGPRDRFESWILFIANPGHWAMRGYGYWMIEETASGRLLGTCGIIKHDGWPAPELGWQLFNGCEGHGYAREAAIAARDWAAAQGMDQLISFIAPDNTRSLALAAKLDAMQMGEGDSPFGPMTVWLHPKGNA
ncbi:GNAT family N-acetyltransferase [Paracoccus sp. (in: a-proteobacteria)]|uniref:GNAT family N-acetyltransferase n=1 Tax=Paracoccus sp. TaxID=267 RepID=UPI0026E10D50|nr:GNAT family N-acetyltransferase [Paracoccus sp. (in: a-proteobacteria)]MDO5646961.1 GNAT family N-acetyltransferase [Paracoccus sp. (in: a-proteobacteria)]